MKHLHLATSKSSKGMNLNSFSLLDSRELSNAHGKLRVESNTVLTLHGFGERIRIVNKRQFYMKNINVILAGNDWTKPQFYIASFCAQLQCFVTAYVYQWPNQKIYMRSWMHLDI